MAKRKSCTNCQHCGWEPDSDIYCGHPIAFQEIGQFGASPIAMARSNLCVSDDIGPNLWEPRHD